MIHRARLAPTPEVADLGEGEGWVHTARCPCGQNRRSYQRSEAAAWVAAHTTATTAPVQTLIPGLANVMTQKRGGTGGHRG
ncbi:hypothetical protein [Nocardiopsis ansamitocini]|uniref:Uncharacterized protein n=1 Tax=Nocardiopsis ansamitocini TaxID=1670832 RepID=A0A9W6P359_9ACTN|nr:hypothetical protein [Nocardiopsis ansamitocini]GLU46301.1 hypothetical protein Nans01_06520 [Nocardiopsis ansamitocini]